MHGSSTSKHNPARLHGCYASKELGLDSVRTSSKGRERVCLMCVRRRHDHLLGAPDAPKRGSRMSRSVMIMLLMHRIHRNPGMCGRGLQPGTNFRNEKVSLTPTLITNCIPIRSHSRGQQRTRVTNRRLRAGPPHKPTVDGMEEGRQGHSRPAERRSRPPPLRSAPLGPHRGAVHPKRRIRVRWAAPDVQIHSTGVQLIHHPVVSGLAGRSQPDAPHLHRRAWQYAPGVSWTAGPRPPTASAGRLD